MPLVARPPGVPVISTAPYSERPAGVRVSETPTGCEEPAPSVNELALRRTSPSVLPRLGETSPLGDCTHGRSATLTAIDVPVVLEILSEPTFPGFAVCSKMPGETDRPPPAASAWPAPAPPASSAIAAIAD